MYSNDPVTTASLRFVSIKIYSFLLVGEEPSVPRTKKGNVRLRGLGRLPAVQTEPGIWAFLSTTTCLPHHDLGQPLETAVVIKTSQDPELLATQLLLAS